MTTYQTAFQLPAVTVAPPTMQVSRSVTGSPPAEVISGIQVQQTITIVDTAGNPETRGFTSFMWNWTPDPSLQTSDLATALAAAGWDTAMPCLDPTQTYKLSFTANPTS